MYICNNGRKNLQMFEICIYQVDIKGIVKIYNLAQEIWKT
jgi:hypothetical protein